MLKMINLAFNNLPHALKLPCYNQSRPISRTKDSKEDSREAQKRCIPVLKTASKLVSEISLKSK